MAKFFGGIGESIGNFLSFIFRFAEYGIYSMSFFYILNRQMLGSVGEEYEQQVILNTAARELNNWGYFLAAMLLSNNPVVIFLIYILPIMLIAIRGFNWFRGLRAA